MTSKEYQETINFWLKKDTDSAKVPPDALWKAIEEYILENNTCALATGFGDNIRCTPIEYAWYDGAFWIFSEGGRKFFGLEHNLNVCLAIFDKYFDFGTLKGMQITGTAELVEPFSKEYVHAAEEKQISIDALKHLPFRMHLIKVVPLEIDFLNSSFKQNGFNARQHFSIKDKK